jgi:hypothetical protein
MDDFWDTLEEIDELEDVEDELLENSGSNVDCTVSAHFNVLGKEGRLSD